MYCFLGLQEKKALDIRQNQIQHIKVVMDTVGVRQPANEYHVKWFTEAVDMALSVNV